MKLTDKRSNIKVDISFNMDTAVKGAALIQVRASIFDSFILDYAAWTERDIVKETLSSM